MACLLGVVLALAVCVTHLPFGNMKQHFGGLVKPYGGSQIDLAGSLDGSGLLSFVIWS